MNAEKILLTHFSARYPKMPPQILDQDATPATSTEPLTAPSQPPSVSVLPDVPMDSAVSPPFPATTSEPEPREEQKRAIIGLAFDHMNITLGEFWKLRTYLPAMDQALAGDGEDGDAEGGVTEKMAD